MTEFAIKRLNSGGLITNYKCSSECRHCLYACSPQRKNYYISGQDAFRYFSTIKEMGCNSVHIGGGEPLLSIKGLEKVLGAAAKAMVKVEYVETNSSWFKDHDSACKTLERLKKAGLDTLLVSISPFHSEFTPLYKVDGVINACNKTGVRVFPWVSDFYEDIARFDKTQTVSIEDLTGLFGESYPESVVKRYWIQPNGRAVNFLKNVYKMQSAVDLSSDRTGCSELLQTSHFHIDLYGNYIPGLCSGFSIRVSDLGKVLDNKKYPLLNTLYRYGPGGLVDMACEKGYRLEHEYLNKCHLCQDIRRFLLRERGYDTIELQPREFYAFL
ncbi:MAG: radical SAM protein [Candidatus Rifleibacteriota bacterium]